MDFGSILTQIWTQFWLISEPDFGLKTGPLRGPVLSENTRNYNVFLNFGGTQKGSILSHFLAHFGLHFDPLFGSPVLGSAGRLKSAFFLVLILAQGRRLENSHGQAID